MKTASIPALLLFCSTLFLFFSCETMKFEVRDDMTQGEYFQRAQEAADQNNWEVAHSYYTAFIAKFPEDTPNIVAAEYEISFIKMKQGKYEEARKGLTALVEKYNAGFDQIVPEWPRVLSEKLLTEIPETGAEKTPAAVK